jgi:serpin B
VELPYVGGSLAMTVIVPDDLAAFERSLDAATVAEITGSLATHAVTLSYPKHSIESKLELEAVLAAMGMPTAFEPGRADFSGITTDAPLFISAVIHQANMDVDEKGTTAAAATAIVMRGSAPGGPVTVVVDRPFLFALRDVATGTILFLGRVTDPTAKAS